MTIEERRSAEAPSVWMDGVRLGYPRLRAAGAELLGEGLAFTDLTRLFEQTSERSYVDVCHLNERGYALMAEAVIEEFARVLR